MASLKFLKRRKLFFSLYLLLFTLIALEVGSRIYLTCFLKKSVHSKFEFDYGRIYKHKPGFTEGDKKGNWIVINQQGFRRKKNVSKIKPDNTYRIFLMGGSAAHGVSSAPPNPVVHVYMNQTIDFYLEELLKKKYPGKNFEVINAAVTGYQCYQHTAYLIQEIIDYSPDLVFFMDGINDHFITNPSYNYFSDSKYMFWKTRLQQPSLAGLKDYFMLWLSKYSAFARGYFARKLAWDAYEKDLLLPQLFPSAITDEKLKILQKICAEKGYLRAIENNLNILASHQIDALVTLQPIEILRDEKLLSPVELKYLDHSMDYVKPLYAQVSEQLKNITRKNTTAFLDFNPAFTSEKHRGEQLFLDYCHLNAKGNLLAATTIFPIVDSLYLSK